MTRLLLTLMTTLACAQTPARSSHTQESLGELIGPDAKYLRTAIDDDEMMRGRTVLSAKYTVGTTHEVMVELTSRECGGRERLVALYGRWGATHWRLSGSTRRLGRTAIRGDLACADAERVLSWLDGIKRNGDMPDLGMPADLPPTNVGRALNFLTFEELGSTRDDFLFAVDYKVDTIQKIVILKDARVVMVKTRFWSH